MINVSEFWDFEGGIKYCKKKAFEKLLLLQLSVWLSISSMEEAAKRE